MSNKINWEIILDEDTREVCKLNLPDAELLDYYKRISNRELFINGDVDDFLVDFSLKIIEWNKQDASLPIDQKKIIKVFIHTDGGDVAAMNNFISTVQLSKTPCMTIGMGKCLSAGSMLLLSGTKGMRYIFPTTTAMVHKGSSGIISDVNKIINYANFLSKEEERNKKYILENTKITAKKYKEVEDKDWYLLSEDIIEFGLADKMITDLSEIY
jgi:ATP-dependent Clp protease protease subunit